MLTSPPLTSFTIFPSNMKVCTNIPQHNRPFRLVQKVKRKYLHLVITESPYINQNGHKDKFITSKVPGNFVERNNFTSRLVRHKQFASNTYRGQCSAFSHGFAFLSGSQTGINKRKRNPSSSSCGSYSLLHRQPIRLLVKLMALFM